MVRIQISNDLSGRIVVYFPNTQEFLGCHCEKRSDEAISKSHQTLKGIVPDFVVSARSNDLRTERSVVVESGLSPKFDMRITDLCVKKN